MHTKSTDGVGNLVSEYYDSRNMLCCHIIHEKNRLNKEYVTTNFEYESEKEKQVILEYKHLGNNFVVCNKINNFAIIGDLLAYVCP